MAMYKATPVATPLTAASELAAAAAAKAKMVLYVSEDCQVGRRSPADSPKILSLPSSTAEKLSDSVRKDFGFSD